MHRECLHRHVSVQQTTTTTSLPNQTASHVHLMAVSPAHLAHALPAWAPMVCEHLRPVPALHSTTVTLQCLRIVLPVQIRHASRATRQVA